MNKLLPFVLLAACGGGDAGPDADLPDPDPDFDDTDARIDVLERHYPDGSGNLLIQGQLVTEAPPWPYDVEAPVGDCRYSTRRPQTCNPWCEDDMACVDDVCVAMPVVRSVGTITVAGGGATREVPLGKAGYQLYEDDVVFDAGDQLTVSAPGDELGAFSLTAATPPALVLLGRDELHLRIGEPLVIRWTPADPGSRVRLTFGADNGHAQYRAAVIECDAPDEHGVIAIPQDLVDRFADGANWACGDCFSHEVERYRRASTTVDGTPLQLWVSAHDSLYLVPEA